ncbi:MAG: tyrosine-type recombinase/integrase [Terracidiphilus sp.]|jgi:integrase
MTVYQRGGIWWYEFKFLGQRIRESSYSGSKNLAQRMERERRRSLELGNAGLKPAKIPLLFSIAARDWLETNKAHWSTSNSRIEGYNLDHLQPFFGKILLSDISPDDISRYQAARQKEGASPRTINMEIGTLRAILRKARLWANIQPDVRMLGVRNEIGRALSNDEQHRLLAACKSSRSRSLYPAVLLSLHTGLRNQELRLLRWQQIDLVGRALIVGKSKTASGEGREIPLSATALKCMQEWRSNFPDAALSHFVFPSERYGLDGESGYDDGKVLPYSIRPEVAIGSWKVAWTAARTKAGVNCRWHDLRHTFVSKMAEGQASDATIMALAGHLSRKMMERYSHVRNEAKRIAISALDPLPSRKPRTKRTAPPKKGRAAVDTTIAAPSLAPQAQLGLF